MIEAARISCKNKLQEEKKALLCRLQRFAPLSNEVTSVLCSYTRSYAYTHAHAQSNLLVLTVLLEHLHASCRCLRPGRRNYKIMFQFFILRYMNGLHHCRMCSCDFDHAHVMLECALQLHMPLHKLMHDALCLTPRSSLRPGRRNCTPLHPLNPMQ